jgi:ATPase
LKQSKIILIDEGLNEIDILLERKILLNIFKKYSNKTIIIISHRLDNLDLYDISITLNDGTVKEVISKNE